jgi:hypothetical protein
MICVGCNKEREPNHKCDPKLVNRIEAIRASVENRKEREPNYGTRLQDGFAMLNGRIGYIG